MYVCTLKRYYDRVYFHFRHLEFEPSGQQSLPIPRASKLASSVKIHVLRVEEILKSYKNQKIFRMYLHVYRNCLQRYTKCVAFLELNGVKKKLSSLIMGHFPNASFRRSFDGSARNIIQAVRNIDFSYFINLIRNSTTSRPLELDVQPTFCVEGTGGRETGRKGGRRCTGGGRRGGGKQDSQGGGKREKKGKIMQHCAIFRNRKNAK